MHSETLMLLILNLKGINSLEVDVTKKQSDYYFTSKEHHFTQYYNNYKYVNIYFL